VCVCVCVCVSPPEVDEDPRRSVAGGVLILEDVEFSDTAVYQCEAANKHGNILLNTYLYVIGTTDLMTFITTVRMTTTTTTTCVLRAPASDPVL